MDGSYGNVFGGGPPMTPDTPTSSSDQYKVNVSRQKTRKWAEFKPQNYDGDDWGADYDDNPDEQPPPPPLKPTGPRQPSAPPPISRAAAPGGPPSLQLQTQRAVSTPSGPFTAGGNLERTGMEHLISPQSAVPQSAGAMTVSSLHSGNTPPPSAHIAPAPPRTRSPAAPLSAGPVPSRFPPRKSSLGPQDSPGPLAGSAPHSRSSSRPGSSRGAPWNEPRPSSPANSRSPISSPAKPLPFVRPADIYRRMEEEKEKERERRSMESAGRPSLDGSSSPNAPRTQPEPSGSKLRTEEAADMGRSLRPSLPPVAERRSEYGLEGLIASYSDPVPDPPPTRNAASTAQGVSSPASGLPLQSTSSSGAPADKTRRFSTSPKLPELGRMSGFGEDLFSMSSSFSTDAPSLPPMPDESKLPPPVTKPAAALNTPSLPDPTKHMESRGVVQDDAVARPRDRAGADPSAPANQPRQSVGPSSPQQHDPAVSGRTMGPGEAKQPARPSLPGGWVTETMATPGEVETPNIAAPEPVSSLPGEEAKPVDMQPMAEPKGDVEKPPTRAVSGDDSDDNVKPKPQSSSPLHQSSPVTLAPLRLSSPTRASTSHPVTPDEAEHDGIRDLGPSASSPVQPQADSQDVEIPPTAPLNPSRSFQATSLPADSTPLGTPGFETSSVPETTTHSPIKESDMLTQEIMKSLSPHSPPNDPLEVPGASTAAYHAAAGSPVRESTYLGDVYGDYWSTTEDRRGSTAAAGGNGGEPVVATTAPMAAPMAAPIAAPMTASGTEGSSTVSQVKSGHTEDISRPPVVPPSSEKQAGELRRKFSWESGPSASVATPPAPESVPGPTPTSSEAVGAVQPKPSMISTPPAQNASLAVPSIETAGGDSREAPAAPISHQVSGASTIPPGSSRDIPIEPPSPISVRSDGPRPSIDDRNPNAVEGKVLVQSLSQPVAPSPPPLDQHPALKAERHEPPSSHPALSTPRTAEAMDLMTFREIMDMPSPVERARLFDETRTKFAAIDTGLDEWMSTMRAQHAEHSHASGSFRASLFGPVPAGDSQVGDPTASQANLPISQPHTNMPMPPTPPHGSGGFGHSPAHIQVAQVGTKSKKLLMAAGKAGKGLLNKGKNKLSGTGDKVFF